MQQPNGDEIAIWKTTDITKVAEAKPTTVWTPKDSLAKYHLWSPEIHRIGNKWYIYFEADDGNTDNHQLYVIENDSPDPTKGKFHLKGAIITNSEWNWGIHPTTFVNKGKQYLLWSGWPKRRIEAETQCIYIASMMPYLSQLSNQASSGEGISSLPIKLTLASAMRRIWS